MATSDPTQVPGNVPEDAVDELFGLPLDEFTPRRDALARELRAAGERGAAAWVKGLRKPTAAAWIVNQLARARAKEAKELLRAGHALRTAQEHVVSGSGDAEELRSAAETEHAAARALLADAGGFLDRAGHAPSGATLDRVRETVRAVALDDEARAAFAKGRLTHERQASGFGPAALAPPPRREKTRGRAGRQKDGSGPTPDREAKARRREAVKKARAAVRELAQALKSTERDLTAAEQDAERAVRKLNSARAGVDRARKNLAEAESRLADAETPSGPRRPADPAPKEPPTRAPSPDPA
jgi:hypothetical protein